MSSDVDVLRSVPGSAESARPPRIAVVGGGISGLAAAHRLLELARRDGRPATVTLFEASDRLGGVFGTRRIGDFVVETGADSFVTDKPWCLDLCRRLSLESRLISIDPRYRRALILHRGCLVPVPEGLNLLAPGSVRGLATTPLLSIRGKLRAACEYCLPRTRAGGDESLATFVRRRFGQEFLERIAQPVVGGIYTADPEKLSLAATLPRFLEMERQDRSLIRSARRHRAAQQTTVDASGARYGLFASFVDGMSELQDALTTSIRSTATIRLNQRVQTIQFQTLDEHNSPHDASNASATHNDPQNPKSKTLNPKSLRLQFADGRTDTFDAALLALPAYAAAGLLSAASPELAALLSRIEYASSAIVVTGHRLSDVSHPLDAAGLVVPQVEQRKVLAVSFLSRKFPTRAPDGHVILRTFVGGALQPQLLDRSDDDLIVLVRTELAEILGVRGEPEFALVARYPRGMPQYHVGHLERVAQIERLAAQVPGLALAGNAFRGVGLPDCIHSGEQAAERIWNGISDPN